MRPSTLASALMVSAPSLVRALLPASRMTRSACRATTVVSTVIKYLEKLEQLQTCNSCHQPVYRLRPRWIGGHLDGVKRLFSYRKLDKLQAKLIRRPKRAEVPVTCEVQLVVEYYAR